MRAILVGIHLLSSLMFSRETRIRRSHLNLCVKSNQAGPGSLNQQMFCIFHLFSTVSITGEITMIENPPTQTDGDILFPNQIELGFIKGFCKPNVGHIL